MLQITDKYSLFSGNVSVRGLRMDRVREVELTGSSISCIWLRLVENMKRFLR